MSSQSKNQKKISVPCESLLNAAKQKKRRSKLFFNDNTSKPSKTTLKCEFSDIACNILDKFNNCSEMQSKELSLKVIDALFESKDKFKLNLQHTSKRCDLLDDLLSDIEKEDGDLQCKSQPMFNSIQELRTKVKKMNFSQRFKTTADTDSIFESFAVKRNKNCSP